MALPEPGSQVPHPHTAPCPLHLAGACSPRKGCSLSTWLWMLWEDCISGLHRSEAIRETVLDKLLPPGHCTDSRLRNIPAFLWKGLFTYPAISAWKDHFRITTHLEAMEVISGNMVGTVGGRWWHHLLSLPWPHNSSLVPPWEEVIHLSGALKSATVAKGTSPDCPVWRPASFMIMVLQDCMCLHTLKVPAWGSSFWPAWN